MSTTKVTEKHITAIMMGAALCFAFFVTGFTAVHAEEAEDTNVDSEEVSSDDAEKRAAMKEQIESLRKMIAERNGEKKAEYQEKKEEHKEMIAEKKAEFKVDKAEFMASLEGLDEEDKRAAMMEFIQNIRALIDAKKAEMQAQVEMKKEERAEAKTERTENRDEFRSSLEGMSKEDKIAAILARVQAIKAQMESNDDEDMDEEEEEVAEEDEDEDDEDDSEDDDEEEVEVEDEV